MVFLSHTGTPSMQGETNKNPMCNYSNVVLETKLIVFILVKMSKRVIKIASNTAFSGFPFPGRDTRIWAPKKGKDNKNLSNKNNDLDS